MKSSIQNIFLLYIRILAKLQLLKIKPIIVGITGSEGKSSTVTAMTKVLSTKYKVKRTGKANSETGIPLDILGLEVKEYSMLNWIKLALLAVWKLLTNWKKYDVYVVEMGIDSPFEPKNMEYLLKIIQPNIGVLTSISSVHAENYQPLLKDNTLNEEQKIEFLRYEIAKEKGKLIKTALQKGGSAVVNIDNEYIEKLIVQEKLDVYAISKQNIENNKILKIETITNSTEGFNVVYNYAGQKLKLSIKSALLGEEFAYTFGYAIQVGLALGIHPDAAIAALEDYEAPEGRFRVLEGIKKSKLIDSTYNSSPVSLENALEIISKIKWNHRKIVVLGDMRELGEIETEEHARLARIAAKYKFDQYFLIGKNMTTVFEKELNLEGIDQTNIHSFKNALALGESLKDKIQEKDLVLFKGSQNTIFLEEALKKILPGETNPQTPSPLLCRQSKWWLDKKTEYFNSTN